MIALESNQHISYITALECPEHSSYTQCASACPGTCFQPEDPACPHICVEGCECDDGFLYDGEECVRQEECGCEGPMSYLEVRLMII